MCGVGVCKVKLLNMMLKIKVIKKKIVMALPETSRVIMFTCGRDLIRSLKNVIDGYTTGRNS
jgi:hypothetical protein